MPGPTKTWKERLKKFLDDNPEVAQRREDALAELSEYERATMERYEEEENKAYAGYRKNIRGMKLSSWAGVP